MKLPFQKKKPSEITPEELEKELELCRERGEFLLSSMVLLISCIKEFAFDYTEIHADEFMTSLEELKQHLTVTKSTDILRRRFAGKPGEILDFINRERVYLHERERELKNIIQMLRSGMTTMYGDTQAFSAKIQESNLRMERIVHLDDIRRIKEQLRSEVDAIKSTVAEKKASDLRQMEKLYQEVDTLRKNLEHVTDVSQTDSLTGAYNRLAFDMKLQRLIDLSNISNEQFSLLLCDLDGFKQINDTHGHQVGDRVLVSFVREGKTCFRGQDFIARYGGEEFAFILPGAPLRNAIKRAQVFCSTLANKKFTVDKEDPDRLLTFTASIGVSEVKRGDTMETIIKRADRALYLAKSKGKNRVMSEQDVARLEKSGKLTPSHHDPATV